MQKLIKPRNTYRQLLEASIGALAVFSLAFVLIPTLISEASATNLVGMGADWAAISLTLDPDYEATQGGESPSLPTHGSVDFGEITPTAKASGVANSSAGNVGTLEILKKTIRIDTTGNYYQVFLSMNDDNSNALLNTTNSYITVPAISGDGINAGTWSSPAYFSSQGWGYAVTGDTEAITLPTFFTASTASINSSLGNELTYANDESVYTGVKFSAVPLLSNPQQIYKNTTNIVGGFSDNNADTFNVYYGVMVNTDVLAGTYNNRIVYTALASAANLDGVSTNVYVEKYIIAKDTEQEISFDLAASTVPSNITTANTHVYLVPHSEMLAAGENGYDIKQLAGYTNPASSYNECEITSLNVADNKSTILCNSPESSNGTADDLTNGTNGMFDYWINITGLNFNYISKTADESETVAYIGLQSTYEEDDGEGGTNTVNYITEMQEMEGSICRNTNMWGTGTGDNARIMDYSGTTQLVADIMTTDEETGEEVVDGFTTSFASAAVGIGTFKLDDSRDKKSYIARRMADGKCWMVANLNLDLATVGILTPEDSDVAANWDPYGSSGGASNFGAFSLDRLGATQDYQYIPLGGSRVIWGSYYYDDPNTGKTLGSEPLNNSYSDFPRSHDLGYSYVTGARDLSSGQMLSGRTETSWNINHASAYRGMVYNYAATTAESLPIGQTGTATQSICPLGWKLPMRSEFVSLVEAHGYAVGGTMNKRVELPFSFANGNGGFPYVSTVSDDSGSAFYWTASSDMTTHSRYFRVTPSNLIASYPYPRSSGMNIRCVARD